MKGKKTLVVITTLLIASFVAYSFRTPIIDTWEDLVEEDIPTVSYNDVRNTAPARPPMRT